MRTIWKYELSTIPDGYGSIEAPAGRIVRAKPYVLDSPHSSIEGATLWIEVDTDAPLITRTFVTHGTGHSIGKTMRHVHTWEASPFVWHLYEVDGTP